ncbi:MAG: pectinacetylesterase family protein, partial [Ghiorsea sp.]|nr:pectinacetylesterase family protein [Ghiorsea sp.]
LLMVGNSAGGSGVMNHIYLITSKLPNTKVKGLTDGSWILDTQPFPSISTIHHDIQTRFATLSMHVDDDCAKAYPKDAWRCIMGEHVYPYIQSPVFVRTSQTDPVHLRRLGVSQHPSPQQNTYIQKHAANICQSLVPVNNFFSLQGTPHTVVKNNRVFSLSYQGQSFYDAIVQFMHQPENNLKITDCSQKAKMGNTH